MKLGDEKYVSLTTFTKDGRAKPTPVWIADLGDGTVGFTTSESSWKAKRIRNTPDVVLQASDMRGRAKPGSEPVRATAEVVTGAGFDPVRERVAGKYGIQFHAIDLWERIGSRFGRPRGTNCAVVITPAG